MSGKLAITGGKLADPDGKALTEGEIGRAHV